MTRLTLRSAGWIAGALLLVSGVAEAQTRRLAIVVGHNTGAPSRLALRYAESDAGKMARVLTELGEVVPSDVFLLQGKRLADVERAVLQVREEIRETHAGLGRAVLYFYFSGHGDTAGLELGPEVLTHERLREMLEGTGADLRVTFVDACRSGGLVQEKGARAVSAFDVQLVDELRTRGAALITSSASDEISLESAEIGGGYFTSHLVTGLRGAADASGDGQVTLSELYRYAHDRTVTSTAATTGTAQHPSYEMSLSGQGELVLARMAKATAALVVPKNVERALVRELVSDQLIAEWVGGSAASAAVAVPPGNYSVTLIHQGKSYGGRVRVEDGERRALELDELRTFTPVAALQPRGISARHAVPPVRRTERIEVALQGLAAPGVGGMLRAGLESASGHAVTGAIVLGTHGEEMWLQDGTVPLQVWRLVGRGGYRFLWTFDRFGAFLGAELAGGLGLRTNVPYANRSTELQVLVGIGPRVGFFYEATADLRLGVVADALFMNVPYGQIGLGFNVSWAR